MPGRAGSINVGTARVDFFADPTGYLAVVKQVQAANAGLAGSYASVGRSAQGQSKLVNQFTSSMRSSIIATGAYVAGITALRVIVGGSVTTFLDIDESLITIAKTTGLASDQLDRLSMSLQAINTTGIGGRGVIPVSRQNLFEIAEIAGQLGIRGVSNITKFTQSVAALSSAADGLPGTEAAQLVGRFLAVTNTATQDVDSITASVTALGNVTAGGEPEILRFARRLAQELAGVVDLSNEVLLGTAAAFVNVGAPPEAASSSLQRLFGALNEKAGTEGGARLIVRIGESAGVAEEEVRSLLEALRAGDDLEDTYSKLFKTIIAGFAALPRVAGPGQVSLGSALKGFFGEASTRRNANIGILTQDLDGLNASLLLSATAAAEGNAQYLEAAKAAEALRNRIAQVGREIGLQRKALGEGLTRVLVNVAEQYKLIEVAAAGAVSVGITRGVLRVAAAYTAQQAALAAAAAAAANFAREQQVSLANTLRTEQARQVSLARNTRSFVASSKTQLIAENELLVAKQRRLVVEGQLAASQAVLIGSPNLRARIVRENASRQAVALAGAARAEATLARTAATTATIAAASGRVGTFTGGARGTGGFARLAVAERQIKERIASTGRLTQATKLQAQAVRNLTFRQQALNRVTRVGVGLYGALGGGIGLVTLAITVGLAAWFLWEKQIDKVTKKSKDLALELQGLIDGLNDQATGLSAAGLVLVDTETQVLELVRQEAELTARLIDRQNNRLRGIGGPAYIRGLKNERQEYVEQREELERLAMTLRTAEEAARGKGTGSTAAQRFFIPDFEALDTKFRSATESVDLFYAEIVAGSEAAVRAAQNEVKLFGQEGVGRIFQELRFAESEQLEQRRRQLEAAVQKAEVRAAAAQRLLQPATASLEQFATGDVGFDQAQRQLETVENIIRQRGIELDLARQTLAFGKEILVVDETRLQTQADAVALSRLNTTLAFDPRENLDIPNLLDAELEARNFVQELRSQIDSQLRELEVAQELRGIFDLGDRAGTAARLGAEIRFAENLERATLQLADAKYILIAAEERLAAAAEVVIAAGVRATEQEYLSLAVAQAGIIQAQAQIDQSTALIDSLERRAEAYRRLAEAAGEVARRLQVEAARAPEFLEIVEEAGVSAINRIGQSLGDLATGGAFSFKQLASSIISDLIRMLIQIVIVDNAIRALRGALGSIGAGLGGATATATPVPVAHGGGLLRDVPILPRSLPLRSGERLAVIEDNEEVLTANDPRHRFNIGGHSPQSLREWVARLPKYHQGGVIGGHSTAAERSGGPRLESIRIINQGSQPMQVEKVSREQIGAEFVTGVVLADFKKNGPINQYISSGGNRR